MLARFACRRLAPVCLASTSSSPSPAVVHTHYSTFPRKADVVTSEKHLFDAMLTDKGIVRPVDGEEGVEGVEAPVSIAKQSMARGMLINEITEDSMVMPELDNMEEMQSLKEFVKLMDFSLANNFDIEEMHKHRRRPVLALEKLNELGINSLTVPKKYGGLGLHRQHWMRVCEELGATDLSLFVNVTANNDFAIWVIERHGTESQKMNYLPRLARGEISAAICMQEPDTGFDLSAFRTHIERPGDYDGTAYLTGTKSYVINAHNADIFIVWAHLEQSGIEGEDENKIHSMYIVDKNEENIPRIRILPRLDTPGLPGVEMSTVQFDRIKLIDSEHLVGGSPVAGFECAMQLIEQSGLSLGAAVVGMAKKVINEYCQFANRTVRYESRLNELPSVRLRISQLAQRTYGLETLVYYTAGHMDASEERVMDVESCVVQREALKLLSELVLTATEVFGADALLSDSRYNRLLRDCTTLSSSAIYVNEDFLTNGIAMSALTAWADTWSPTLEKLRITPDNYFFNLYNQFKAMRHINSPKMKHYLFKHVHPSLENSARMIEESMSKVEIVISMLLSTHGREIEFRHDILVRLADITQNMTLMVAACSRASRSYSVGLKAADEELIIAHKMCLSCQTNVLALLSAIIGLEGKQEVADHMGDKVAGFCLEKNGYPYECPLERNW